MQQVRRAIIMAAGIGKRMRPVTLEIPKPLVKVNGIRMIDTVIQGLHSNGIHEIYVVVGYQKEKFNVLEKEYPSLKLIENPYFNECNNISSLYVAREYIDDTFIIDGDLIIYNDNILSPDFEVSGYNTVWIEQETNEWLLQAKDGVITECSRLGGSKGWQLYSISRWSTEDGKKLRKHLEIEFDDNKNRQIFWDDIALFNYASEYKLGITKMHQGDVVEIDSLIELSEIDMSYKIYLNERDGK